MPKKKHLIDKKIFKQAAGACRICGESNYALLDTHRIKEGSNGGTYTQNNCVTLCSNCHRRVHNKEIIIDKYYPCSNGQDLLRIIRNNEEDFV